MKNLWLVILILFFSCDRPGIVTQYPENYILTPASPLAPQINSPKVYGLRPGSPLIFRIPCTGERPLSFSAVGLPDGLSLDTDKGIIRGTIKNPGKYILKLCASNKHGNSCQELRLHIGDKLALTPPMGWNSWYIHYDRISDELMRRAADHMISSGMADFGYQYVNVDDCWMKKADSNVGKAGGMARKPDGTLNTNERFPDMYALSSYIHEKGLKAGLYISPGPSTCAGYEGSYLHEPVDAKTFADWGFDFLKYDWCSYGKLVQDTLLDSFIRPYRLMSDELKKTGRDIVLNLCQYGMKEVWKWGGEVGHCWRTTGDLGLEKGGVLPGFYTIGLKNAGLWPYARPGAWNDPDYILIGWVGDAHHMGEGKKVELTPFEQYSYMSMWSLMAAPLIFSGDMEKLDPFTLNILCNREVIELNQDPLGQQARPIRYSGTELILAKDMEDGSLAVGLFNLDVESRVIAITWSELNLTGTKKLRDVWRQIDIGWYKDTFCVDVPTHGVYLTRIFN